MASPVSSPLLLLSSSHTIMASAKPPALIEGALLHSRKERHLAMLGEVWIILNLYLYTVLFLYVHTVSSSSLSGDHISECHTEFCAHQQGRTVWALS